MFILLLLAIIHLNYKKKYEKFPLNPKRYPNFLKKKDIDLLLEECNVFQKSTIVKNGKLILDKFRKSKTCFINHESKINKVIKDRIKNIFNIEGNIETLQLTYYDQFNFYNSHYDYFLNENLKDNKQRLKTIFVYLKCPEDGGETNFPLLGKKFIPKLGDAVAWTNCKKVKDKYYYNKMSLHEGSVVKKGKKIGLNIWLTE